MNHLIICMLLILPQTSFAEALRISTTTEISQTGSVIARLFLKNNLAKPLFDLYPMFHFHHSMSMMPMISRLDAGESRTLTSSDHPPVVRVGRYPLVAMVRYRDSKTASDPITQIHTDSFYYEEPVDSVIDGRIESNVKGDESLLRIIVENHSPSFKNVQLMLLLPPGLITDAFKDGIMGFTIHGEEQRYFEIHVKKQSGAPGGVYPVHLMIEYGELQKHYAGEISGQIHFPIAWNEVTLWNHLALACFLLFMVFLFYRRKTASHEIPYL